MMKSMSVHMRSYTIFLWSMVRCMNRCVVDMARGGAVLHDVQVEAQPHIHTSQPSNQAVDEYVCARRLTATDYIMSIHMDNTSSHSR